MSRPMSIAELFEEATNFIAEAQEDYENQKLEEAANEVEDAMEMLTKLLEKITKEIDEAGDA